MKWRRKSLRNNATDFERILWEALRESKLGVKFRRQYSVRNYVVDFYCPQWRLAVELEGGVHLRTKEYDKYRKKYLEAFGVKVISFPNSRVVRDIDGVIREIMRSAPS